MVLWGGLRPIASQLVLDAAVVAGLLYGALSKASYHSIATLLGVLGLVLATSGPTNRWTLTIPMVPLLVLQGLRYLPVMEKAPRAVFIVIAVLSVLCILAGAALSILFPAVELPPIQGPYNVGVVDFHLPVELKDQHACTHVPVRLLYPTHESPQRLPYLDPSYSSEFCGQMMKLGAPPQLANLGWMLHTWRLTPLRARRGASIAPSEEPFPLVLFSHGLGGAPAIYSYQTMSLAAHGHVVLSLTHQDGSSPAVPQLDGSLQTFDFDILKLYQDGKELEYAKERRRRTERRVDELLEATEAMRRLNEEDWLDGLPSLVGKLNLDRTFFMGHSFGAATALSAALRAPDRAHAVVAHEPAIDWMPDEVRRSLYSEDRLEGLTNQYKGGTGGFPSDLKNHSNDLHDKPMLFLNSHEWHSKGWCDVMEEMHQKGRLGRQPGSEFVVIEAAHHNEFSDTSLLTPTWLARAVGATGKKKPADTAHEIATRTRSFINLVLQQS